MWYHGNRCRSPCVRSVFIRGIVIVRSSKAETGVPPYSSDLAATGHASRESRGTLAVVMNGVTPYNVHLARRIANEIHELKLCTIFTVGMHIWKVDIPSQVNPVFFSDRQNWVGPDLRGFRIANEIFEFMQREDVRAVVLAGTASFLHLRLMHHLHTARIPFFLRGDSNIMGDPKRWALGRWFKRRVLRWVLDRCSGVMPFGQFGRRYFEKYGADLSRSYLVPHEPDYDYFQTVDVNALEAFRAQHGLSTERRYLLSCNRLIRPKRVDLLIDSFAAIADKNPEWDLLIVGDGPLRKSLQNRVSQKIRDRVKWLRFCQIGEVRSAFQIADAFVLASDFEPWAVVINEAAAAGLVIVASNVVGAAREIVVDGVSGRIFRSGESPSLRDALTDVMSPDNFSRYQQQVAPLLKQWRAEADPIDGIRAALRDVSVL